ncbi:hypothetical protein CC80DRAFT_279151 [Byssothecium circinans]|uniref:Uncharacterized protein n=1 Tax=Byssothecium circinans TaxID=147558 RepID=A0A6A5TBW0_9PLEO|nr:hypothetical protein CC80DRAFT_279151 [Byssothecium circinans]
MAVQCKKVEVCSEREGEGKLSAAGFSSTPRLPQTSRREVCRNLRCDRCHGCPCVVCLSPRLHELSSASGQRRFISTEHSDADRATTRRGGPVAKQIFRSKHAAAEKSDALNTRQWRLVCMHVFQLGALDLHGGFSTRNPAHRRFVTGPNRGRSHEATD